MKKIKIANIVGARPNFIKIAPLIEKMKEVARFKPLLIHTGQHYDKEMSAVFFKDLDIVYPDICLGVGSGSQSEQVARIMLGLEKALLKIKPDLVVVVGDVNSTLAAGLVSSKLNIPLAHVEAGLRSFDRTMPEETNRLVTDSLSDYLFTTCPEANRNLEREGIPRAKIFFAGNVMIDSLLSFRRKASQLKIFKERFGLGTKEYALLTLHRPSNVDDRREFRNILEALKKISRQLPIIFPAHPRTKKYIELFKLKSYFSGSRIRLIRPLGYLEFFNLMLNARFVLTDSGGIQEETSVLGIPCLTLRKNTERPVTVTRGTNTVVGTGTDRIIREATRILFGKYKEGGNIKFWDGKASQRIVKILSERL